jgi:hypothetical protein
VHDALAPLVSACLAKDPEERPSTLQLSMRLKEIAAREAQGLHDARPPVQRERVELNRPTARYPEHTDRTERMERRTGGSSVPRPQTPSRTGGGSRPQQPRGTARTNGRPGTRPGVRTTSTGRRPANPRLLRQRITVFFVVTLIVALGIAAAQKL